MKFYTLIFLLLCLLHSKRVESSKPEPFVLPYTLEAPLC